MSFDENKLQILNLINILIQSDNCDKKYIKDICNIPDNILDSIFNLQSCFSEILNEINIFNNNKVNNDISILKNKIRDSQRKKILNYIFDYCCLNIQEVNRNYIKFEFEREKIRFEQNNPNKEYIYQNQKDAANKIAKDFFENNKKTISLIALPQIGKTGTFLYVAYLMTTYKSDKILKSDNIFIITGMSDTEWQNQTENDMLPQFKNNVFHRGKLDTFKEKYKEKSGKKLLIIDESHYGSKQEQQLDKIICNIFDIKSIKEIINFDDCLILAVSATPGVTLKDLRNCGEYHSEIYIERPNNYVGFNTFIEQKRMEKSEKITTDFLKNIKNKIKERYNNNFKYHIFRLTQNYHKIIEKFCVENNFLYRGHYSGEKIGSFDKLIEQKPLNHTFIIIKGFYRAGKRLKDKNIGIVYEHTGNVNMESTPQGLIGRFCGNDKINNKNDSPYFYCNIDSIEEYINHYDKGCNFDNYTSTNLRIQNRVIKRENNSCLNRLKDENYKDEYLTIEDYNKQIKDVPFVFKLTKEQYDKLNNDNTNRESIIKDIVKDNEYITNKLNNYTNAKITKPSTYNTNSSYKNHILDSYNAHIKQKPYIHNIPMDQYQYKNIWAVFIDNKEYHNNHIDDLGNDLIMIVIIYHGEKRFQIEQKLLKDNIKVEPNETPNSEKEDEKLVKKVAKSPTKKNTKNK
jgi:hypothetical protein